MSEYYEYLQDRQQVMRPIYNDIFEIFSRHEHDMFEFMDEVSDKYKPRQILLVCRAFDIPHICKKDNYYCYSCRLTLQGWSVPNDKLVSSKLTDLFYAFSPINDNELGTMFK